jgi:hypothetical protein
MYGVPGVDRRSGTGIHFQLGFRPISCDNNGVREFGCLRLGLSRAAARLFNPMIVG